MPLWLWVLIFVASWIFLGLLLARAFGRVARYDPDSGRGGTERPRQLPPLEPSPGSPTWPTADAVESSSVEAGERRKQE